MITELSISNFRHIEQFTIAPLGRITLIGGKNGAGKTALLEALWLFTAPNRPRMTVVLDDFRGIAPRPEADFLPSVFRSFDERKPVVISARRSPHSAPCILRIEAVEGEFTTLPLAPTGVSGFAETADRLQIVSTYTDEDGGEYVSRARRVQQTLDAVLPGSGQLATIGIREDHAQIPHRPSAMIMPSRYRESSESVSEGFGKLQRVGKEDRVTRLLEHLEPSLKSLSVISSGGSPTIHAYIGDSLPIPASLVGEGFVRMLELATGVAAAEGGLLLVDEIENGLHYSTHEAIFSTLFEFAKEFDVQVVATTHSSECVKAAHRALGDRGEDTFTYHRIDRDGDDLRLAHFDSEMMDTAIDLGMEIR